MSAAAPIAAQLDLTISRLEAMGHDLEKRILHAESPDALYLALYLAEAGMSSLTDALGEMRQSAYDLQPHPVPPQGTFREDDEPIEFGNATVVRRAGKAGSLS